MHKLQRWLAQVGAVSRDFHDSCRVWHSEMMKVMMMMTSMADVDCTIRTAFSVTCFLDDGVI